MKAPGNIRPEERERARDEKKKDSFRGSLLSLSPYHPFNDACLVTDSTD